MAVEGKHLACRVLESALGFSSPSVYVFVPAADSPSTVRVQPLASTRSGGIPLLRTNNRFADVTSSFSRCDGVSAHSGRSLSTVKPSLPAIVNGSAWFAQAAGIRPAGMNSWNTILAPTKAVIAPRPRRKPRRVAGSDRRRQRSQSARCGSAEKYS